MSFHKHVSVEQDFSNAHVWGYFIGPVLAMILGIVVFALVQSGLLVFGNGSLNSEQSNVAFLGSLSIGFLAGFGWYSATQKLRSLVKQFFGGDSDSQSAATKQQVTQASSSPPPDQG